jgi:hypothetical protein
MVAVGYLIGIDDDGSFTRQKLGGWEAKEIASGSFLKLFKQKAPV